MISLANVKKLLFCGFVIFSIIFLFSQFSTSITAEPNCSADVIPKDDINYCLDVIDKELKALEPAHEYNKKELASLRKQLDSLNKRITGISTQLDNLQIEIIQREEDLAFAQEIFELKTNNHYKFLRLYDPLLPFLSSDASEAFREMNFRQKAADEDRRTMEAYAQDLYDLKQDKEELEKNQASLAVAKKQVDEREGFLAGEVEKVEAYIATLTSKQQDLLAQKFASVPIPLLAYTSLRGCVSDIDVDPGFSPRFAFFSFGVPNKVGLNQYGAKGRAESNQGYEEILRAYYDNFQIIDYSTSIKITVNGTNDYNQTFYNEVMNIEDYLKHLYEMPTSWTANDSAALKAQAIAARSYALATTNDGQKSILPNQYGQEVKKELNDSNWQNAVEATRGKVMAQNGKPISAWYSSTHGGFVLKSGEIGWNDTSWTKHAVDAGSASSLDALKNSAYDRSSAWFYCDWGYRGSGNTAWLREEEVVDIVNAFILWDLDRNTIIHLSQTDKDVPNTWDAEKVKQEIVARPNGTPVYSINSIQVDWDGSGISHTIRVNGRSFNAQQFKNMFNLRAPANIQMKPACPVDVDLGCKPYALYNVEKK